MQTKASVFNQIKKINLPKQPIVNKEMSVLHAFLYDDEMVESFTSGFFDNHWTLMVATNKRILLLDKGVMRTNTDEFDYKKLTSIQMKKRLTTSIEIKIGSVSKEIKNNNHINAEHFVKCVQNKMYNSDKQANNATIIQNNEPSLADQIRDLKKLVDEGILTQEEFDKKKKQLLGI